MTPSHAFNEHTQLSVVNAYNTTGTQVSVFQGHATFLMWGLLESHWQQ